MAVNAQLRLLAFCGVALVLGLTGCDSPRRASDFVGTYRLVFHHGVETLQLDASGQCSQEIRMSSGQIYRATGRWSFDPRSGYVRLQGVRASLDELWHPNPEMAKVPGDTPQYLPVVYALFGKDTIGLGEGVTYERIR